jgi:hypothetical protein
MRRSGVHRFVTRHRRFTHRLDEDLLAGRVPDVRDDLAPLARFCADLRHEFADEPLGPEVAHLTTWRKRAGMLPTFLTTGIAKIGIGVATASLAVGATAAGAMPAPVQRSVSHIAAHVGVHVPDPGDTADEVDGTEVTPPSTEADEPATTVPEADDTTDTTEPADTTDTTEPADTTDTTEPAHVPNGRGPATAPPASEQGQEHHNDRAPAFNAPTTAPPETPDASEPEHGRGPRVDDPGHGHDGQPETEDPADDTPDTGGGDGHGHGHQGGGDSTDSSAD